MLSKHPDKCRFPHGHTRKVELVLEADALDGNDMVCDFKAVKEAVGEFLEGFDHAMCMNVADPMYRRDEETVRRPDHRLREDRPDDRGAGQGGVRSSASPAGRGIGGRIKYPMQPGCAWRRCGSGKRVVPGRSTSRRARLPDELRHAPAVARHAEDARHAGRADRPRRHLRPDVSHRRARPGQPAAARDRDHRGVGEPAAPFQGHAHEPFPGSAGAAPGRDHDAHAAGDFARTEEAARRPRRRGWRWSLPISCNARHR